MIVAKKNTAYYLSFPAIDSSTPASYKSGILPIDTAYYKDGAGAWTSLAIADTATEIGTSGSYEIDLTAAEMNHDKVLIKFSVSGMADDAYQFDLRAKLTTDLNDFNPAGDTVANVGTVATNTDMRGTDSANTVVPDNASIGTILADTNDLQVQIGIAGAGLSNIGTVATVTDITNLHSSSATAANLAIVDTVVDGIQADLSNAVDGLGAIKTAIDAVPTTDNTANIASILADTNELQAAWTDGGRLDLLLDQVITDIAALNNVSVAEVNAQIVDVLKTDTISELAVGIPPTTPTMEQVLMYIYMALRNKIDVTATVKEFNNSTGITIWKKVLSDDGTTYTEASGISG